MHNLPVLLIIGIISIGGFYFGRLSGKARLPSIIGFMILGLIAGPSVLNVIDDGLQSSLSFISEIALGFVALTIGLELSFLSLKKLGASIIIIIFAESFGAFILVTAGLYLLTRDMPLSLIFGAIAPASAPAGTVAVIQECKAKGSLTKALYAVVGFDDGLGIIIFGFAAAVARSMIIHDAGSAEAASFISVVVKPLVEIILSLGTGAAVALLFCILARKMDNTRDIFVLTFGFVLISTGISNYLHLSLILTNLIVGMVIVNTQPHTMVKKIGEGMNGIMPLLFILFFSLAGSNLHIKSLPSLKLIGIVYIILRSAGLMGGAWFGSVVTKAEDKIRKYLGLGILSQAGVAIGLSLVVVNKFSGVGKVIADGNTTVCSGDKLGTMVLTTVTATCIFFELVGPILTKIGLTKAGEINKEN